MALHPKFEKERENMFEPMPEAKPCPKSGLTPDCCQTSATPDLRWCHAYECDARCPHLKECKHATALHLYKSDAIRDWNIIMDAMQSTSVSQPEPQPITMPVSTDIALEIKADTFLNPVGDLCSGMKIRLIDAHNKEERIAAAVFYDSSTRCVRISCL